MSKLLVLLLSLGLSTSCMKKLSESDDDGPTVSSLEVQNSLFKAWGDDTPHLIYQNEFVNIDTSQRIQDNDPVVVMQKGTTVTSRSIDTAENLILFDMVVQTTEINGDDSKTSSQEYSVSTPNVEAATSSTDLSPLRLAKSGEVSQKSLNLSVSIMLAMASLCQKAENWDVTCHNLTYSEEIRDVPAAVKKRTDCGGVANCQMNVRKVTFDLIRTVEEDNNTTSRQKYQFSLAFSPDVPYIARLIENCQRSMIMVPAAGQKVLVGLCDRVTDFQFGKKANTP